MENTTPNNPTLATLVEAIRYFTDPDTCLNYLIPIRWPNGTIEAVTGVLSNGRFYVKQGMPAAVRR